jgi:hypothetical protein
MPNTYGPPTEEGVRASLAHLEPPPAAPACRGGEAQSGISKELQQASVKSPVKLLLGAEASPAGLTATTSIVSVPSGT